MFVMIDEETGNRYARLVEQKGLGDGIMDWLVVDASTEIGSWGHNEYQPSIMKSVNEEAVKVVCAAISRYIGNPTTPEFSPKGESLSNGTVEEAGKLIREVFKVYKCQLEEKVGTLPEGAIILQWMARWTAMAHNRYQHGCDGKTAYQRQTGRTCRSEAIPFGELVLYRESRTKNEKKEAMEVKWREGV